MDGYTLYNDDFTKWIKDYDPEQNGYFQVVLGDPPYSLIENSKRFSAPDAAEVKYGTDGLFQRQAKGFMGQTWDGFASLKEYQEWVTSWAAGLHRICYPGAIVAMFGGSRTYHRLAVGLEDAGLEIIDIIMWVYGSGFPKSLNIGLAIDKQMGIQAPKERRIRVDGKDVGNYAPGESIGVMSEFDSNLSRKPITPDGQNWAGHATSLKPAYEPLIIARVPRGNRTYADLALSFGAGALNIEAGRIESAGADEAGRYPSNVLLTHNPNCTESACVLPCPIAEMNAQSGYSKSGGKIKKRSAKRAKHNGAEFHYGEGVYNNGYTDEGGAARFFFSGKAPTWERHLPGYISPSDKLTDDEIKYFRENCNTSPEWGSITEFDEITGAAFKADKLRPDLHRYCIPTRATHPTVKPIQLTTYLAGLFLPAPTLHLRNILIPFAGVGSEMIGALLAGWDKVTGVELTEEYIPQAVTRLEWWTKHHSYESAQDVYNQSRKQKNIGRKQRQAESESGVKNLTLFD